MFIVNKAGSLIFYRRLHDKSPQLSQNDTLHLASTFHGMQLLVQQLSPEFSTPQGYGIVSLLTDDFALEAFKAASGVQFFATADLQDAENLALFLVCHFRRSKFLTFLKFFSRVSQDRLTLFF